MNKIQEVNKALESGEIDKSGIFPHLDALKASAFVFDIDFGLKTLPIEPGIIMVRGPRQYGKSTWLEQQLKMTIKTFGPASAFYLNGEEILSLEELESQLQSLIPAFKKNTQVKRIFIDEITIIPQWEIALKRMADRNELKDILIVTTGSKATDLRRGSEKLPGRKGKLDRTDYIFTPISYKEFHKKCHKQLKDKTLLSYLISGGSPIACNELVNCGKLPEYVINLMRDWIEGEVAASGRSRTSLINIFKALLFRFGGSSIGQAKLARESGLSNNTVAAGYIELLADLCCINSSFPWDSEREIILLRKPCKYHFVNVLAAVAYHPNRIRCVDDFLQLNSEEQGMWYEWFVAQEIARRQSILGDELLAPQKFWQSKKHEIDFVLDNQNYLEVKLGHCSALEFAWFVKSLPSKQLTIINTKTFATKMLCGQTLEDFLLEK